MAQNFGSDSTQCSILYNLSSQNNSASNASVTLTDSTGTKLVEFTPTKRCNSVVISSPELSVGETYTLTFGDETVEIEMTDALYSNASQFGRGF